MWDFSGLVFLLTFKNRLNETLKAEVQKLFLAPYDVLKNVMNGILEFFLSHIFRQQKKLYENFLNLHYFQQNYSIKICVNKLTWKIHVYS